jgi:NADH-quinone oxidoreductase subunit C
VDAQALRDHLVAELGAEGSGEPQGGAPVGGVVAPEISHGLLTVTVAPGDWRRTAELVRRDPELSCNFFDFLCGVDEEAEGIGVVLHVYSISHRHHVQVRAVVPRDGGRLPTVHDLWAGANWHERETHELFGVEFDGHPNLSKLLLPEEFEGFPLRKEFALLAREAKPWPGAKEPGE